MRFQNLTTTPKVLLCLGLSFGLGCLLVWKRELAEEEAGEGGEAPEEEEAEETVLDVQVVLGISAVLILVTILFEKGKHHVEHEFPHHMMAVISALFGELTVLGFIALYTYAMLQTGLLPELSRVVYGDKEELVEKFEEVHFTLFFVMITFLVQAYVLVSAVLSAERRWGDIEEIISGGGYSLTSQVCEDQLEAAVAKAKASWFGPLDLLARYRVSEAEDALQYALLRQRFILHPRLPNEDGLPRNFNFSAYLRTLISETVSHLLHVTELTWVFVVLAIFGALELPVLVSKFGTTAVHALHLPKAALHLVPDFTSVGWFVAFALLMCLGQLIVDGKLSSTWTKGRRDSALPALAAGRDSTGSGRRSTLIGIAKRH